ncbi:Dual specificity protein phosphatase 1 [Sciurus carolinensis]|uniref:Dual specificity protein phosphatase 1 n=1 Tax=Sciurus carolinensis TaxID=30640 RepID=A0AA41MME2_SCICA|nr:Dual specificity protein phosphatase 1 [Sciurus carolinensis]
MWLSLPLSASVPDSTESRCNSCSTLLYDQGGLVEILHFLYLVSAYNRYKTGVFPKGHAGCLGHHCPEGHLSSLSYFKDHNQYKRYKSNIPVKDKHKVDISSWFNEVINFIDSIKNVGEGCLFTARTNLVKLDDACEFVKQRQSNISPNSSFMGQLLQFESQVLVPHCSAEARSPTIPVLD